MTKANTFMAASWIGLAGLILTGAGQSPLASSAFAKIGITLVILGSFAMLLTRRADEYTEGLWNAGASVAFGTMLLAFPGLPAAEGFYDGLTGNESGRDIPATIIPVLAIAAFYIGLFVKRLLGDR